MHPTKSVRMVSILVLMELSLRHPNRSPQNYNKKSFNPCFNGTLFETDQLWYGKEGDVWGFNPCFNGTLFETPSLRWITFMSYNVSILVLMELSLRHYSTDPVFSLIESFNPCFNGTLFETPSASRLSCMRAPFQSLF